MQDRRHASSQHTSRFKCLSPKLSPGERKEKRNKNARNKRNQTSSEPDLTGSYRMKGKWQSERDDGDDEEEERRQGTKQTRQVLEVLSSYV